MKGLLIKDLKLLKNQRTFFLIVCLAGVMLMVTNAEPSFVISYLTFIFSVFTISSISYDEYDNGYAFLFSLPVSRKTYVREKYLFGLILGGGAWLVSTLMVSASVAARGMVTDWREWLVTACVYLIMFFIFILVILPLQLKFGSEKGRVAMISVVAVIFILSFFAVKLVTWLGIDIDAALARLAAAGMAQILGGAAVVCCVLAVVSYNISQNIMKKKEF